MPTSARLRGVVREPLEGRSAFRRVTLVSGKKTIATVDAGEVGVDLAEGGAAAVEAPGEGLTIVGGEPVVHHGAWGDLRDREDAAGLTRNVLPPYAPATLSVLALQPGQYVEIYGVVLEEAFAEEEGSMREAPAKHPSRVLAEIVAIADAPEDAMRAMTGAIADRKTALAVDAPAPPAPTDPADPRFRTAPVEWLPVGVGGLAAGGLVIGARMSTSPVDAWRYEIVAAAWAALAWSMRPTPYVPSFNTRQTAIKNRSGPEFLLRIALGVAPLLLSYNVLDSPRERLSVNALSALSLVFIAGWLISEFLWNRENHVLLGRLAGAPLVSCSSAAGRSGACEGTVACVSPVRVAGHEAAFGLETKWSRSRRDSKIEGAKLLTNGPFAIATGDGSVTVDPDECLWSTTLTSSDRQAFQTLVSEWIEAKGRIAAFGHFRAAEKHGRPSLRVASLGTRPAVLLASGATGDPLRLARRVVWQRRATLLGLVLLALVVGVLVVVSPA